MIITTINYWNNNNKMRIIVLMILTLTLMISGIQSKAAELNNRPYTKVEQSMNISNDFISGEYHFVETYGQSVSNSNYVTIGYVNDSNNKSWFLETENLDGKLIERIQIENDIKWGYVNSIDDLTVAVTTVKDGNLVFPVIWFIGNDGKVFEAYKCEGTTEENVKNGALVKYDGKVFYSYPTATNLVMISLDENKNVVLEMYKYGESGSLAYLFYDKINDKLWASYRYSNKGRLFDYVYMIDSLSDLNYSTASKKKITREGTGANPAFTIASDDLVYINYSKKNYTYTYSTGKFVAYSGSIDNNVVLDNENRLIYFEDVKSSNNQVGRNIYFVNKQGNYDIELFDNDKTTLYVGGNGLEIKGIIHSSNDEIVDAKIVFNNESKIVQFKTNEEFRLHLSSDFLKEGYYDDIYIEVGSSSNNAVMSGQIPNGSIINYNGIFYDKVDDTLAVERNPKEFVYITSSSYDSLDKTSLLTDEEWNKYKENISAIDRLNFWLQDGKKSYFGSVLGSKGVGYAYLINKKIIKLNEKFSLNKTDNVYYNYALSSSRAEYNKDVWVSYAPCKSPLVSISSNSEFTNDDVTMTVSFDGECADLTLKIHVIRESIDAYDEYDLDFDFSKIDSYTHVFTESGIYQISVQATSSFGNKSSAVIKTFKIDKDAPILDSVNYDAEVSSNGVLWSLTREIDAHIVLKDLCGIPNAKQLDKYLWQIESKVQSHKELPLNVEDYLGNETTIKLENAFLVDELAPILQKPVVEYFKDRCEITLKAFDTESGLEGIYYKIGNEDEKKYERTITFERDKYGQNNPVLIYARDIAGNKTENINMNVNLNDAPEIIIDDEYVEVTLNELPKIVIAVNDKDGDDVKLSLLLNGELLCSNNNEILIDLNDYENLIRKLDYNVNVKFEIIAFDGMEQTSKSLYIKKKNMTPIYKITTKHINFSNYAEVDVSIYDLDDGIYGNTVCKLSSNGVELGTYELIPGDNLITIKNACLEGDHEIKFELINKNYKTTFIRKMNFVNLDKIEEENIFIKIADVYSNEFFKYALTAANNLFFYTDNADRYLTEDFMIPVCNLMDSKNYVKKGIPVIIYDSNITDNDLLELLNESEESLTVCYETGSTVDIEPIIFSDYEGDYYSFDRGKNRKLNVDFEKMEFENTKDNYNLTVYDPLNNTTRDNTKNSNVTFDKEKLEFEISNSGLYTLSLSEWDEIKNDDKDYSKESDIKSISFYAHKRPYCKLTYEEIKTNGDIVTLRVTKEAKDDDFLSINNGIWKERVIVSTYSFEGELLKEVELDDNSKTFEININKNQITKIKYIVTDFGISPTDNRFSFSTLDEIVINKINTDPFADFDYYLENNAFTNGYIYRMNNHESLKFKNLSYYNDILATSGERDEEYQYDLEKFKSMIDDGSELSNRLTVWNKFGKKDTSISKRLEVVDIDLINVSNLDSVSKGSSLIFDIINSKNKNEIYLLYDGQKIDCINDEYQIYVQNCSDEIILNLKVYSNRDGSYLGEKEFQVTFVEDSQILDFEITNIYDPWCEAKTPAGVSELPVGIIRKGYGFDFEVTTRGLNKSDDYVYIFPKYYFIENGHVVPCEIVKYNKGLVHPYELKILNDGKQIGTLDYLYLDNDDRWINNNDEIYHGKFYLPSDARIKVDDKVLNEGLVLVNFEIISGSSSGFLYNYNSSKWALFNNSPYNISGDTAIYSLKFTALDDYKNYLKY